MAKSFHQLREKMAPSARRAAHKKALILLKEMSLQELRQAKDI